MSKAAAAQHLKDALRRGTHSMPVMFFGTLEVAWVSERDTVAWAEGVHMGLLTRCAMRYRRAFNAGVQQVDTGHPMFLCRGYACCNPEPAGGPTVSSSMMLGRSAACMSVQRVSC